MAPGAERVDELEADARYSRQRADLDRAKTYSARPTSPARMRELERAAEGAQERLRRARDRERATAGGPSR